LEKVRKDDLSNNTQIGSNNMEIKEKVQGNNSMERISDHEEEYIKINEQSLQIKMQRMPPLCEDIPMWINILIGKINLPSRLLGPYCPNYIEPMPVFEIIEQLALFLTMKKLPALVKNNGDKLELIEPVIKESKEHHSEVLYHAATTRRNSKTKQVDFFYR
jgi:hypothetical protein